MSRAAAELGLDIEPPAPKKKAKRVSRKVVAQLDSKLVQLLKDARALLTEMDDFISTEHDGKTLTAAPRAQAEPASRGSCGAGEVPA